MAVPDRNGAGVRPEGDGLTLRRVLMEDGEQGLLTSVDSEGAVVIEDSEFRRLGRDGYAHAIYISGCDAFILHRLKVHSGKDEGQRSNAGRGAT